MIDKEKFPPPILLHCIDKSKKYYISDGAFEKLSPIPAKALTNSRSSLIDWSEKCVIYAEDSKIKLIFLCISFQKRTLFDRRVDLI